MANETGAERFWRGEDANEPGFCRVQGEVDFEAVFEFTEAYKDSCTRELEARIAEREAEVWELKAQLSKRAGVTQWPDVEG